MSHNHYLGCRACDKTTESQSESHGTGQPHSCFSRLDGGDEAVTNALAIREIYKAGIFSMDHRSPLATWAPFIAEHAACNAFYELCGQAEDPWENVSCQCPRRIVVKGAASPPCESCFGRRLVPCPVCAEAGPTKTSLQKVLADLERNGCWGTCVDCYTTLDPGECPNFARYDHKLTAASFAEQIVRKFGAKA